MLQEAVQGHTHLQDGWATLILISACAGSIAHSKDTNAAVVSYGLSEPSLQRELAAVGPNRALVRC